MSGTRSFSYDLLDSHQGLLYPQQHGSFAATRLVLSVLQDASSCAEVAHAVLGMRSLKEGRCHIVEAGAASSSSSAVLWAACG